MFKVITCYCVWDEHVTVSYFCHPVSAFISTNLIEQNFTYIRQIWYGQGQTGVANL